MALPVPRWARPSIGFKLAMPVALIAGLVLLAFLWAAVQQVQRLSIDAAEERLERVARQLAAASEANVQARAAEMRELIERAEFRRFLSAPSASADTLRALLLDRLPAEGERQAFVVIDARGRSLLEVGDAARIAPWFPPLAESQPSVAPGAPAAPYWVGPVRATGTDFYYDTWVGVPGDERPTAYLGHRRIIITSPYTRELVSGLLGAWGSTATISYGNGGVWTDLAELVPRPASMQHFTRPAQTGLGPFVQRVAFDSPEKGAQMAAIATVRETPWLVVVERDRDGVLTPVNRMTDRLGGLAIVLVLLGGLGALVIGQRITRPLNRITRTTRLMEAFDDMPELHRTDEIGRLAQSFRRMREEVLAARSGLERQIRARTAKLRETVQELEATRDELVRREKLNVLSQLSAAVSNEFRNCLAVIRNATFVIASREKGQSELADNQIDALNRQVGLCERIILNLLDLGQTESPATRRVRLRGLIDEQLERLEVPSAIEVVRDPEGEALRVLVDPVQVGQALFNLLLNAVQAMSDGGTLTLRSRRRDDDHVELEVADTGPGVPADQSERIFEPLYTSKSSGTGLGLSVSRALVRANGGDITVRNEDGAVFTLVLPSAAGNASADDGSEDGGGAATGTQEAG